ncbi:MAG: winged helix DNA-binding domain-containing protein [Candidatus Dormibacteraeota bacterium]|nr:winged helix DNA-binding domain-containing protein [Candidatus Dormibacteraeota bacterium]
MRARAQRLTRDTAPGTRPDTILREVCGLQAQVWSAATLGMRARSAGLEAGKVDQALNQDRSIVRTWLMRGTLHVVAAEDVRWLLDLLGPVFARAGATRHAQLGLDDDLKARGVTTIRKVLAEAGPLTRYALVDRLRSRHMVLDPKTQAPIHLIALAALQGILCLGPGRDDGASTYVLLDDWVPRTPMPSRETALAELARRYFAAYGPATIDDLSAWSGLAMIEARSAVSGARAGLTEVMIQGRPGFVRKQRLRLRAAVLETDVRLLPAFDTYLLGYRRRDLAVPLPLQRRLQRGGGWLHPAVVVSGRAMAAWSLRKSGARGGQVLLEPSQPLPKTVRAGIEAEVADIGRFLDLRLTVEITS